MGETSVFPARRFAITRQRIRRKITGDVEGRRRVSYERSPPRDGDLSASKRAEFAFRDRVGKENKIGAEPEDNGADADALLL